MKHIDLITVDASGVEQAQAAKDAGAAVNGIAAVALPPSPHASPASKRPGMQSPQIV